MPIAEPASSAAVERPPYRIPPMAEIAKLRGSAGLRAVSTFSGAGGSCLGLEWAGFDVVWASEFVPEAAEVYRLNHPGVPVNTLDVRKLKVSELLDEAGLAIGEADLVEGSPPCSSFSTAGKRHLGWGQSAAYSSTKQRTDDLFYEFARLVEGVQPRVFVAENVSGLVKGVAIGYFKAILRRLRDCGYRVEAQLLDSQWLGVPQARQRLFFVGVRNDLDREPAFPTPLRYRYSIRDAIGPSVVRVTGRTGPHFARVESEIDKPMNAILQTDPEQTRYEVDDAGSSWTSVDGDGAIVDPETGYRLSLEGYAVAPEWDKLGPGESSERYFSLVRPDERRPSPTITQVGGSSMGTASVTHPAERRKFSLGELRRISGFPDDFRLSGSYSQRWERIGRAVPPPMMRAVADVVRDEILCPS